MATKVAELSTPAARADDALHAPHVRDVVPGGRGVRSRTSSGTCRPPHHPALRPGPPLPGAPPTHTLGRLFDPASAPEVPQ